MIRVELARLIINERSDEQVIYLREIDADRQFPIVIGAFEAFAIDRILKDGPALGRPLTHDLLARVIEASGFELKRILIDDLEDDTYFAKLILQRDDVEHRVDARPSDAITLALKTRVPVFVAEKVMEAAAEPSQEE